MRSILVAVLALASCGGFIDRQAASTTLRILDSSQIAARRLGDVELAREAMAAGIVQLEGFARAYPQEPRFADMHADAVCDYATAFVFDDWEDADLAGRTTEAARAADRLRILLADCVALQNARLPRGWTPGTLRPVDVPAALAIARARTTLFALAPMNALGELPGLRVLLERCATVRPGYHDADAELLLGSLAAGLSRFTGGSDGSEWFDRAQRLAGDGVLMVRVMRVRASNLAHRDRVAYERALGRVISADLTRWPDHRLANALAVRKAHRYLAAEAARNGETEIEATPR